MVLPQENNLVLALVYYWLKPPVSQMYLPMYPMIHIKPISNFIILSIMITIELLQEDFASEK